MTGVQTCALPICLAGHERRRDVRHVADATGDLRRTIADEHAEADSESGEHDQRFDETREDGPDPLAAIDRDHVAEHVSPARWMRKIVANGGEQPA